MKKLSSNPAQAYLQGLNEGKKTARADDIVRGIRLTFAYLLLAMAYTNEKDDGSTFLSKPKFAEFYQEFATNLHNFVNDSIEGESGLDTYDIADLYVGHDRAIRERYKLPQKNYDGKDDVL